MTNPEMPEGGEMNEAGAQLSETEKEFERKIEISRQCFDVAGFNLGDKVTNEVWDEKEQKRIPESGWEIVAFDTLSTKGREVPAVRITNSSPDVKAVVDTVRIQDLCMMNPLKDFK